MAFFAGTVFSAVRATAYEPAPSDTTDQSLLGFYARWQVSRIMPFGIELADTAQRIYQVATTQTWHTPLPYLSNEPSSVINADQIAAASTQAPTENRSLLEFVVAWQVSRVAPGLFDAMPAVNSVLWLDDHYHNLLADNTIVSSVASVGKLVASQDVAIPNNFMYVRFSKPFLQAYFARQVERRGAVNQTILGAAVRGTSHTLGRTALELMNNPAQAEAKLVLTGRTNFDTVSYSGPVEIFGRGATNFLATKKIWFDGLNVQQTPAQVTATTHTQTTGIDTDRWLFHRIILRIAGRREAENHAQAEQITAQRTKDRVAHEFDATGIERAEKFSQVLRAQYAKLPLEGRFTITDIRCSTTTDMLEIQVLGRGDGEPRLVDAPCMLAGHPDIELQIHSAMLRKAMVDPELRNAFEMALRSVVDRPNSSSKVVPTALDKIRASEDGPKFHWSDGDADWLRVSWDAKDDSN